MAQLSSAQTRMVKKYRGLETRRLKTLRKHGTPDQKSWANWELQRRAGPAKPRPQAHAKVTAEALTTEPKRRAKKRSSKTRASTPSGLAAGGKKAYRSVTELTGRIGKKFKEMY